MTTGSHQPFTNRCFLWIHDYELILLQQKVIDAPNGNLNHHDTYVCENLDDILIHANNLSHTFVLPQFMSQHNYEDMKPIGTPSTTPTAIQASSDQTCNPKCAHKQLATQCNQSQSPNINHNFALPQLNAKHNCEDLDPTDSSSTVPSAFQASCDHL